MDLSQALNPKTWRKVGAVSVGAATLMAVYGAASGILHDSVLHMAILMSAEVAEQATPDRAGSFCIVYWLVMLLLVLVALYMAFLDLRYIRVMYLMEKRQLLRQSLEDGGGVGSGTDGD